MNYQFELLFFQPITPLHVGCGQDIGVVDLPVIRERTTGYPFIPGSGIRGSVRALLAESERTARPPAPAGAGAPAAAAEEEVAALLGPAAGRDDESEDRYAGCVAVHDAHLLLFPVRSDQGVVLWITCPAVLARFARDVHAFLGAEAGARWNAAPAAGPDEDERAFGSGDFHSPLYLEEFSFTLDTGPAARDSWSRLSSWAARIGREVGAPELAARTVLVADRAFYHFAQHATILLQHNRLTSAKTVVDGGLFSVEAVPPEAVFYGFFGATRERRPGAEGETRREPLEVLRDLRALWNRAAPAGYLHLGGDEGTGLGVTHLVWASGGGEAAHEP